MKTEILPVCFAYSWFRLVSTWHYIFQAKLICPVTTLVQIRCHYWRVKLTRLTDAFVYYLLLFQAYRTSGSVIAWRCAAPSRMSNSHLTADGRLSLTVITVRKKSSTNFWIVPLVDNRRVRNISGTVLWLRSFRWRRWSSMGFTCGCGKANVIEWKFNYLKKIGTIKLSFNDNGNIQLTRCHIRTPGLPPLEMTGQGDELFIVPTEGRTNKKQSDEGFEACIRTRLWWCKFQQKLSLLK